MNRFVWLPPLLSILLIGSLVLLSGQELQVQSSTQETSQPPVNAKSMPQLTPGKPIEQELKGGEKHTYPLTLKASDYLKLVVEQRGIDVVVRLLGPDGKTLQEVDSPNGTQGPEPISAIIDQGGSYSIEIEALEKTAPFGKYELKLEPVRPATEQDRAQIEIEKQATEVEKLRQAGKYDQALSLAQQVLDKVEKVFGSEHILVGRSLSNLANLYRAKGDYSRAEPLFLRSLAISEKILGANHPVVAHRLNELAILYYHKSEYALAEPLYLRALAIMEKAVEGDNPGTALMLSNLAVLYISTGDYARAEPLLVRSLGIYEKTLGAENVDVAATLNYLGVLYREKSDYTQAEPFFVRALAIREKIMQADHPYLAESLTNLAGFYRAKGDFAKVEPLYMRALAIYEKALGPEHPLVANCLNNMAVFYFGNKGDYARAEPLLLRSVMIREKTVGVNHPGTADSLLNLAGLYSDKGEPTRAEPLYVRALAIYEKALGTNHPLVALCLSYLSKLYYERGEYAMAETMLARSLAIREKTFGADHPDVATTLNNLARLYQATGKTILAIQYQIRGNDSTEHDLVRNLVAGSELQKSLYLKQTVDSRNCTISLHIQAALHDLTASQAALTVILRHKGRELDAMTNIIAILRNQQSLEIQKLLDDYAKLASQISVLTLRGPGTKKPETHLVDLRSLEDQKEKLENEISRRSGEFKVKTTLITLEAVQKLIPADAALVEYAVYRPYDVKANRFGKPRYVAYVLRQGTGDRGQGTGMENQGTGDRGQGAGSGKQGSGFRGQASGSGVKEAQPRQEASALAETGFKEKDEIQKAEPGTRNPEPCFGLTWVTPK